MNKEYENYIAVTKLYKQVFNTDEGRQLIKGLESVFINRAVYKPGMSFEETAYREGERSVVMKIIQEVNREIKHGN